MDRGDWQATVHEVTKSWTQLNNFHFMHIYTYNALHICTCDILENKMATHSSILAWRIPWTKELGGLQSMVLQRVRHD